VDVLVTKSGYAVVASLMQAVISMLRKRRDRLVLRLWLGTTVFEALLRHVQLEAELPECPPEVATGTA
jgi:hypothetical protein